MTGELIVPQASGSHPCLAETIRKFTPSTLAEDYSWIVIVSLSAS